MTRMPTWIERPHCLTAVGRRVRQRASQGLAGIAVGTVLALSVNVAVAQEQQSATGRQASTHRFVDVTNIALTGMESAALLADGIYTQRGLTRYPEAFREADSLARPFVSRGWPGQVAGGALVVSADVGLRYWLHRKKRHRLERLVPLILTVYGTVGAIHNAREIRRYERTLRQ